jgi:HAMP domain-containing protein
VSRVSRSLAGVEEEVRKLRWGVAAALGLAFLVTALLPALLSSSLARSLQELMRAARQFSAGDLSARGRVARSDELGELAQILNQSADALQQRLTENSRDRARTEAILSSMEDGVLAVDHRGVVLLANNALRRGLDLGDPLGHHYMEAIRQREVGEVIEGVLRSGERRAVEVELRHLRRAFALTAVPFPGAEAMPTARCSRSTTCRSGAAWSASAATSWPTPPTSSERLSPPSAASWRRWKTAPSRSRARPAGSSARSAPTPIGWPPSWRISWS